MSFFDGFANVVISLLILSLGLLTRSYIFKNIGIKESGIYQFVISLTSYYTPLLTNLIWGSFFYKISSVNLNTINCNKLIYKYLIFIIATLAFISILIIIFLPYIIQIIATKEYLISQNFLLLQIIGDFCYYIFYFYTIILLSQRLTKEYLIFNFYYILLQVLIIYTLIILNIADILYYFLIYIFSSLIFSLYSLFKLHKIFIEKKIFNQILRIIVISFSPAGVGPLRLAGGGGDGVLTTTGAATGL